MRFVLDVITGLRKYDMLSIQEVLNNSNITTRKTSGSVRRHPPSQIPVHSHLVAIVYIGY